jgi:hypothetical protein
MTFLLIYDWACGQLVSLSEVDGDPEAACSAAAWAHADDPSIEVRLVRADSRADVLRDLSGPSEAPSR